MHRQVCIGTNVLSSVTTMSAFMTFCGFILLLYCYCCCCCCCYCCCCCCYFCCCCCFYCCCCWWWCCCCCRCSCRCCCCCWWCCCFMFCFKQLGAAFSNLQKTKSERTDDTLSIHTFCIQNRYFIVLTSWHISIHIYMLQSQRCCKEILINITVFITFCGVLKISY